MIRIQSKVDGFRRCDIAHSVEPTDYPDDHFTAEQLAVLEAEPMLVVEVLAKEFYQEAAAKPGDPGKVAHNAAGGADKPSDPGKAAPQAKRSRSRK